MARMVNRLTARKVATESNPGMYPDGNGLYMQVTKNAAKSWIFRFRAGNGKRHDMGLGSCLNVSLAEARNKADAARKERGKGLNPVEARRQEQAERRLKAASVVTFREAAKKYIETHEEGWKNEKHRWQWNQTLESFAFPVVGDLSVAAVDTTHILEILEPLWPTKTETASRLRGRLEKILDWARVKKFREGENPARWKGHLDHLLVAKSQVQKRAHYPALPHAELPAFMALLRQKEGISALALQFQILNANRSGEVLGARWEEFDLDGAVWTIPAKRMKRRKGEKPIPHRIPFSSAAMDILKAMRAVSGEYVFPGRRGAQLSDMALSTLIRRMHANELKQGRKGFLDPNLNEVAVPHGFRSSFKDWVSETTDFANIVSEMALAHVIPNKVEAAYRRGDLFQKRRKLMADWADFALGAVGASTGVDSAIPNL